MGIKLATLPLLDIPEPFAAFLTPVPTIFGATYPSFKLVAAMVLFYLNWLAQVCFVAKN